MEVIRINLNRGSYFNAFLNIPRICLGVIAPLVILVNYQIVAIAKYFSTSRIRGKMVNIQTHIPKSLLQIRLEKDMTCKQMAEKAGIHLEEYIELEDGLRLPTTNHLYRLSALLDLDPSQLKKSCSYYYRSV